MVVTARRPSRLPCRREAAESRLRCPFVNAGEGHGRSGLVIGLDGDDTLWGNEDHFRRTESEFERLVTRWARGDSVRERLLTVERRNLGTFGYGVKGFTLSMIETAIELSGGEVPAYDIHRIVELGRQLLEHPVELLDGVRETVDELARRHPLVLVTKGDLLHQETKIAASGLADTFWRIEIVSEKDPATYQRILDRHGIEPASFVMVGNSVPSDVLPVLALGGRAVHVPYHLTWEMETAPPAAVADAAFPVLDRLADLPSLLDRWATAASGA